MTDQLVIFGASGGGIRVAKTLISLNIDFCFFVDNDMRKWGQVLEGKEICSPDRLSEKGKNYKIIIASEYQKEIEAQLDAMGLADRRVVKEQYIINYIISQLECFKYLEELVIAPHRERQIFIDLLEGVKLGGIETWSFTVARGLVKVGAPVKILSTKTEEQWPEDLAESMIDTEASYQDYWGTVQRLVTIFAENLPCSVIINKQTQALYAGYIVKHYFPEQIKLISVVHNDLLSYYRKQTALVDYVDAIACVSLDIKKRFIDEFRLPAHKLHYKESAVTFDETFDKEYTKDRTIPLRLGFAARLAKAQKRADLLIPFIQGLEMNKINYIFTIAGNGPYYPTLEEYVVNNDLSSRVRLLGQIDREDMSSFWKQQDVFVSVSDYEGSSLSLLEAMSYGVVPVQTRVSGANEFIETGVNGYLCRTGDIEQAVNCVIELEQRRDLLSTFGASCREIIRSKCDWEDYIDFLFYLANS